MSTLDEIEKELYKRDGKEYLSEKRDPVKKSEPAKRLGTEWGKPPPPEKPIIPKIPMPDRNFFASLQKPALIAAAVLMVIGLGYGFLKYFTAAPELAISINGPADVTAGNSYTYDVVLQNQAHSQITNAVVTLNANDGIYFTDSPNDQAVVKEISGALDPDSSQKQSFGLFFLAKQGDTKTVSVNVRYQLGASGQHFEKTQTLNVKIDRAAVSLNLNLPNQVVSGDSFSGSASWTNMSSHSFVDGQMNIDFPQDFSLLDSTPTKAIDSNSWDVGAVGATGSGQVNWLGKLSTSANQARTFHAVFGVKARGVFVPLAETSSDISAIANPLYVSISLNGANQYNAHLGEALEYTITFKNDYDIGLQNVVITAKLNSPMFDLASFQGEGYLSSVDRTVTWNGGNTPQLLVLNPGESGLVKFSVKVLSQFADQLKAQTLDVPVQISSDTKPKYLGSVSLVSANADLQSKLNGTLAVQSKVLRNDPSVSFLNGGPWPMHVNQTSQFSVHIKVGAIGNDFQNVTAHTVLPSGVSYAGNSSGNISGTQVIANPRTGEVDWQIPSLAAYENRELVFQINATPNVSQLNNLMKLLDVVTLNGTDSLTSEQPSVSSVAVTSQLPDDPSAGGVSANQGVVQP